jgi:methylmalonyl-CoA mutase
VEKRGGFLAALRQGFIQASVEEIASKRRGDIEKRREVFLGSNQYPNTREILSETVDMKKAFPAEAETENSVVKPLRLFRGAEEFEKLRMAAEKSSKRPSVFILAVGNPAMRLARTQFTANFFGCGGYKIIDNGGYKTVADGVKAAAAADATIVVLCSSDEEYATLAPEAFELIGGKSLFVVAGAPECMEELKAKGINRFISIRSNVLETLRQFHSEIGITI